MSQSLSMSMPSIRLPAGRACRVWRGRLDSEPMDLFNESTVER